MRLSRAAAERPGEGRDRQGDAELLVPLTEADVEAAVVAAAAAIGDLVGLRAVARVGACSHGALVVFFK